MSLPESFAVACKMTGPLDFEIQLIRDRGAAIALVRGDLRETRERIEHGETQRDRLKAREAKWRAEAAERKQWKLERAAARAQARIDRGDPPIAVRKPSKTAPPIRTVAGASTLEQDAACLRYLHERKAKGQPNERG